MNLPHVRRLITLFACLASPLFAQKNVTGEWGPIINWPHIPVHIGHFADGRLVTWASTQPTTFPAGATFTYAAIYDPATNTVTNHNNTKHDMFCTGIATTPDGRIFASGGGATVKTTTFIGNNTQWGNNWVQMSNMNQTRWYSSSVTLPDGDVFTWWGKGSNGIPEILDPASGLWTQKTGINVSGSADPNDGVDDDNHWYPHLHLIPNGKIFQAGPLKTLRYLDWTGNGSYQNVGTRTPDGDRHRKLGMSVQYLPGKILFTGGRDDRYSPSVTNTAVKIDVTGSAPVTTAASSMNYARAFHYALMLPNGEVFVVGGNTSGIKFSDSGGVLIPEIWNPASNQWRTLPAMAQPRGYHLVSILLRDGRVLVGGGGLCGCSADHQNIQIYSPGYLFNSSGGAAARPTISSAPYELKPGLTITVNGSDDITAFNMIRLQGTTHGINSDQRFIPVSFSKPASGQYTLTLDSSANVLLPGLYWIFALNSNGTPSHGYPVRVFSSAEWPGFGNAPVNLAKGKTATQISTHESASASRAVDGNHNGSYDLGSVSHTQSAAQPYWQVDLGAVSNLSKIKIWNRTDCCGDRLTNFHVFVSDAAFTGTSVSQSQSQPGVLDLAFPGTAGQVTEFNVNRTGRYVRVQLSGNSYLHLAEVEVFGTSNSAPTVSVTSPANGASFVSPASITINATASDPDNNLAKVEFLNGSTKLGEDATSPYSFTWSNVAAGSYTLTARAVDSAGLTASSSVNVTVTAPPSNSPPTVSLTSPANGTTYTAPASIAMNATASDPDNNLTKVEFLNGSTKLGEDTISPYSFTWSNVAAGSYTLTARAVDAGGLTASANVSVTVGAAPPPPPTGNPYLSDLTWISAVNGLGPVEKDKNNGGSAAGDGGPIKIAGVTYAKGVGTYANSQVVYSLGGNCTRLQATAGVDDTSAGGVVIFQIFADGVKIYDSGFAPAGVPEPVDVIVTGRNQLSLVANHVDWGSGDDKANWGNARLTCGTPPPPPPSDGTFLSDLTWTSATNSRGPVEKDKNNGGSAAGDGGPIRIAGVTYTKGLGTFANSQVVYSLGGNCTRLQAVAGVDDTSVGGAVIFQVFADGVKIYDSGFATPGIPEPIDVSLTGRSQLSLVANHVSWGSGDNLANWGNARITCGVAPPPPPTDGTFLSDLNWTSATNGLGPVEKDKNNGGSAAGDGGVISIAGTLYAKGLGTFANSRVKYTLSGACTAFRSTAGVDDSSVGGAVIFQVWGNGVKLYDSGFATPGVPEPVDINISGVTQLELVADHVSWGSGDDKANWGSARVVCP